jgi:hypothetical protein
LIEKYDTELEVWVILDVKLSFDLNEYHHIFAIMEGNLDVFKKDAEKQEF